MGDFDDINSYNGDLEHDMWVDYNYFLNTGEYDDEEEQEEYDNEEYDNEEYDNEEEFEDEYQQKVNEAIKRIRKILSDACDSDEEQKRQK